MPDLASSAVNIVGGGIAGLIAAVRLARAGAQVSVFESAGAMGGRARTRQADGYFLNQGPHALYLGGAFHRELTELGIPFSGRRTNAPDPQALWKGRMYALPRGAGSLLTTGLFDAGEKLTYMRVLKAIADGATGEGTFSAWLDGQKLTPRLRASVEALARVTSYTHAPDMVSAAAMLDQIRLGLGGVMYIDGGWASVVDGLMEAARAHGAMLHSGAGVERVMVEGRRARVVLSDGLERVADATILAVGPNEAAAMAPAVASLKTEAGEARAIRANCLDLALSRWPKEARQFVLGIDQNFYLSLHSEAAKLAPEGGAVVHIARYLGPGEGPQRDAISELEELADKAIPGWRALEVKRQELRGMVVSNAVVRADRARPGVELADAPGLFIAGDWVGDEGMISDTSAASAAKAAEAAQHWLVQCPSRSAA